MKNKQIKEFLKAYLLIALITFCIIPLTSIPFWVGVKGTAIVGIMLLARYMPYDFFGWKGMWYGYKEGSIK